MSNINKSHIRKIDSIRGFAVLGVLFFHSGISWFSGGYAGVDVFFVLSGFLVSESISTRINSNNFNFIDFYARRIKRIFPAALTTLLVVILIGKLVLFVEEWEELKNAILSFFLLNTEVWAESSVNYFGIAVDFKPLIHFWSLSVELKYYIILPVILYLAHTFVSKNRVFLVAFSIFTISFLYTAYLSFIEPSSLYFSFFARIWQFYLGVLLCQILLTYDVNKFKFISSDIVCFFGYVLILLSYLLFDSESNFPGYLSLIPCVATVILIINAKSKSKSKGNVLSRLLSNVGMISFSLYLIHQPVLAYFRIVIGRELNLFNTIMAISTSFLIAMLLYKFIEMHFNDKSVKSPSVYIFCISISLSNLFLIYLPLDNGNEKSDYYMSFRYENNPRLRECRISNKLINIDEICSYGQYDKGHRKFFIWGDSHVDQIVLPLSEVLATKNIGIKEASISGCPPIIGFMSISKERKCENNNKIVYDFIMNDKSITDVVLHAFWIGYFDKGISSRDNSVVNLTSSFSNMIDKIIKSGKNVHVIYPVPQMKFNPPMYFARGELFSNLISLSYPTLSKDEYRENAKNSLTFLDMALKGLNVNVIYPSEMLYNEMEDQFNFIIDGRIIYRDDNHLSLSGGRYISTTVVNNLLKAHK